MKKKVKNVFVLTLSVAAPTASIILADRHASKNDVVTIFEVML